MTTIPFAEIGAASLSSSRALLPQWFPAGKMRGREFVFGDLSGSPGDSMSVNLNTGLWSDFAGGLSGGDLISLYAHAFHGGDMGDGARALAALVGIDCDGRAPSSQVAPAPTVEPEPTEIWEPCRAPPDAAPPDLARFDGVWTYRDADGAIISYVVRVNKPGGKKLVYGKYYWHRIWTDARGKLRDETGWHDKHPPEPMPLYDLDRLAARPDAPVLVVEGEKDCDAATAMFPGHVCVTWPRGTNNCERVDWTPLARRWVVIWPDNDPVHKVSGRRPGQDAAAKIEGILHGISADVFTLEVDDLMLGDEPNGEGAADLVTNDPIAWLEAHMPVQPSRTPGPDEDARDADEPEFQIPDGPECSPYSGYDRDAMTEGVIPLGQDRNEVKTVDLELTGGIIALGHDHQTFFYYSESAEQTWTLTADRHSRASLVGMANEGYFWDRQNHLKNERGSVDWARAGGWLMSLCRQRGIFDPSRIRGRGAWLDEGRSVLHLGRELIVDRSRSPLLLARSHFIYEAGQSIPLPITNELSNAEAHKLIKVCEALRWTRKNDARLLAGWIVLAPICGALNWRPSIWITGGPGSGKSWLSENVVGRVLAKIALSVQSKTSEAGIRQTLGSDARPVIFDEAEREDTQSALRMQGVLDLVRQSSSEGGAEIIKGTGNQTGSKRYKIRSMFMLSSINVGLQHAADESRVTVLSLRDPPRDPSPESVRVFANTEAFACETLSPEYAAALIIRTVALIPIIRANAETFARAIASGLGSRRLGDQLGTLLAGAFSLHSSSLITAEAAADYVNSGEWTESAEAEDDREEHRLMRKILSSPLRVGSTDYSVSRLMEAAITVFPIDGLPSASLAHRALCDAGIKLGSRSATNPKLGLFVSGSHDGIKRMLQGHACSASWNRTLVRLPGAEGGRDVEVTTFSPGIKTRAAWIPLEALQLDG